MNAVQCFLARRPKGIKRLLALKVGILSLGLTIKVIVSRRLFYSMCFVMLHIISDHLQSE